MAVATPVKNTLRFSQVGLALVPSSRSQASFTRAVASMVWLRRSRCISPLAMRRISVCTPLASSLTASSSPADARSNSTVRSPARGSGIGMGFRLEERVRQTGTAAARVVTLDLPGARSLGGATSTGAVGPHPPQPFSASPAHAIPPGSLPADHGPSTASEMAADPSRQAPVGQSRPGPGVGPQPGTKGPGRGSPRSPRPPHRGDEPGCSGGSGPVAGRAAHRDAGDAPGGLDG